MRVHGMILRRNGTYGSQAMLKMLAMRGFRGFQSYAMNKLTRVNLIVGKNNCGKTTVLEAAELLASNGHPAAFADVARRRREMLSLTRGYGVDISHLFSGHVCEPGVHFELTSDRHKTSATILSLDEVGEDAESWDLDRRNTRQRTIDADDEPEPEFGLRIATGDDGPRSVFPVDKVGTLMYDSWRRSTRSGPSETPVRFLGLGSPANDTMHDAWNDVIAGGREDEIARDMQILVPEIASIHFLTSGTMGGSTTLVGLRGGGRRIPIGSYGDGLRRLLALRLALQEANHGFLLIDEIDAGLHWTVMEDVWRLLVEVAKEADVQVFATTHSQDCIRGLGSLVKSRPDLAPHLSVQKVHTSLDHAVCFDGEQIAIAVEQEIDLR